MSVRPHPDSTQFGAAARDGGSESAPAKVGRHDVTGVLGVGGMGEVYAVRDPRLGREVAAKLIRGTATPAMAAKFHREARITGSLEHPGIVPLYELGATEGGEPYFTMRKVQGVTLRQRLDGPDPPDLPAKLAIFTKACEAIAYAHAQGVIHRDLKPENLMTGPFGEVYVMDWGLARFVGRDDDEPAASAPPTGAPDHGPTHPGTQDGAVVGTPAFMSPEQAAGRVHDLGPQTDVYALGAILYVLLCGQAPYDGPTPWAVIGQILDGPPPPPSARAPRQAVPWELEAVAMRALAHDPRDRYPSAQALEADVSAYIAGRMVKAARYGVVRALGKWIAAHRVVLGATTAVALAAIAVAGSFALRDYRARRAQVALAREALFAEDPASAIDGARRVVLPDDPAARALPPAGELSAISDLAARVQRATRAAADWARLAPADPEPARWQCGLLLALGRLAEARLEDAYAASAYLQAAALEVDDGTAARLAERAAGGVAARRELRRIAIARRLDEAGKGELDDEGAFVSAVAELASYRESPTVIALAAEVDQGVARLLRGAAEALAAAGADSAAAERLAGARFDPAAPGTASEERRALAALEIALVDLAPITNEHDKPSATTLMARQQDAALNEGGIRRDARLKLACAVLGRLDDAAGSIGPLVRLAWADVGGRHALAAGSALALLASRSRDAERALLAMVGLTPDQERWRYDLNGPFWAQVGRELARVRRRTGLDDDGDRSAPRTAMEWNRRAVARMSVGDDEGALADFDRALGLDPGSALAYTNRGCIRERRGDLPGAIADQTRAIELAPMHPTGWMNRGNARRAARDLDGALADLTRAIELDPKDALAYANRGNVHRVRRDFDKAYADFDRSHELSPRFTGALVSRGQARGAQGDHARAIADFTQAIDLDPRHAQAYALRAAARYQIHDYGGALADCDKAIALEPRGSTGRWTRARVRLALHDDPGAVADLTHLLALEPTSTLYLGMRGAARLSISDLPGATADLDRAIELGTTDAEVYVNRSTARQYARDYAGALADIDRAIELEPTLAAAYTNRAVLRQVLGQPDRALRDFDRAVELDPKSAHAWRRRAELRYAERDLDGASADLDRAVALDAKHAGTLRMRGCVRAERRDLGGAVDDLQAAIALAPSDWDAHMRLGVVHHLQGIPERSAEAFRRALELAPPNRRAVVEAAQRDLPRR